MPELTSPNFGPPENHWFKCVLGRNLLSFPGEYHHFCCAKGNFTISHPRLVGKARRASNQALVMLSSNLGNVVMFGPGWNSDVSTVLLALVWAMCIYTIYSYCIYNDLLQNRWWFFMYACICAYMHALCIYQCSYFYIHILCFGSWFYDDIGCINPSFNRLRMPSKVIVYVYLFILIGHAGNFWWRQHAPENQLLSCEVDGGFFGVSKIQQSVESRLTICHKCPF